MRRAVGQAAAPPPGAIGPVTSFRAFVSLHWLIGLDGRLRLGEKRVPGAGLGSGAESIGRRRAVSGRKVREAGPPGVRVV